MGKKSRRQNQPDAVPARPKRREVDFVERPFEGLPREADLVAMREILPAATARFTVDGTPVVLVTFLPDHLPGLRREDGTVVVALQTRLHSGDASRDAAYAIEQALALEPGTPLLLSELPEPGTRLQDLLSPDDDIDFQLHHDFEFWVDPTAERTPELEDALRQAAESTYPMVQVPGVESAYWTRIGKEFLRWVRPEPENEVLDALARLQARRETDLEEGVRLIGAFRACGLLVPVWELMPGTEADELAEPCQQLERRFEEALAAQGNLTADERRARAGMISRQVNLR